MGTADEVLSRAAAADDAAWLDHALKGLPSVPVPAALETRILASFEVVTERRKRGLAGAVDRLAGRLRDAVWPGVPVWRPAAALALSLALGIAAGTVFPLEDMMADGGEQIASIALDAPPAFDLGENS